jgi:hypothetical protein
MRYSLTNKLHQKYSNYPTQPSTQTSTICEANHGNLTQQCSQPSTIDHNVTNTCEIGNSSRMEHINTIPGTELRTARSTMLAEWIDRLPLIEMVHSKSSTESRPFFSETLPQEESKHFGKTESSGIHQQSPKTRLAQSPEPCMPYYDLRTASCGYYEPMTLNTNII